MAEHSCRACVLYCIDFRFHRQLERFLREQDLDREGTDIVRIAGVAKGLAGSASAERDFIVNQLEISHRLHHTRQIYLVNHEDCGAYGLEQEVDSEQELACHREDLRAARQLLAERFPQIEILTYFIRLSGEAERVN